MIGMVVQPPLEQAQDALGLDGEFGCSPHERRVTTIALRLFDLLSRTHRLDNSYRKVLRYAAMLHDAGRRFGALDHEVTGARLIWETESIRLSSWERRCVAYLIRYHSGKVPRIAESEYLHADDGRRKVKCLLAFLRAADGLDSRRISASTIVVKRSGRKVHIHCWVKNSLVKAREAFRRRRKFRLLEESLRLDVTVRVDRLAA